jgi:hypothetical protein
LIPEADIRLKKMEVTSLTETIIKAGLVGLINKAKARVEEIVAEKLEIQSAMEPDISELVKML